MLLSKTPAELAAATAAAASMASSAATDGHAVAPHDQLAAVEHHHAQLSEEQLVGAMLRNVNLNVFSLGLSNATEEQQVYSAIW